MRVLVTRPEEDALDLCLKLKALGHEPILEPLLRIAPVKNATVDLTDVRALLITSANGLRAFASLCHERSLLVLTVGDASKQAALAAGFTKVESATGDVDALADLVRTTLGPDEGVLLHPAGSKVAGDLAGLLEAAGYRYRRAVLYEAVKSTGLSGATKKALKSQDIGGVVFFSPRTAETFVSLAKKARLSKALGATTAFCLSEAVAEKARELTFKTVEVAATPDQETLLKSLEKIQKNTGHEDLGMTDGSAKNSAKDAKKDEKESKAAASAKSATPETAAPASAASEPAKAEKTEQDGKSAAKPAAPSRPVPVPSPPLKKSSGLLAVAIWLVAFSAIVVGAAYVSRGQWYPKAEPHLSDTLKNMLAKYGFAPGGAAKPTPDAAAKPAPVAKAAPEPTPPAPKPVVQDRKLAALEEKRDALKPEMEAMLKRLDDLEKAVSDVKRMVSAVKPPESAGASAEQLSALVERLDNLEKSRNDASSAPGFVLAVGQLRETLNTSKPFTNELEAIKSVAGTSEKIAAALDILSPSAATGIPTVAALRNQFAALAPSIVRASVAPEGQDWMARTVESLTSIISVKRLAGNVEGAGVDAVVARAETALASGDVSGALVALAALKGKPADVAGDWMGVAKQRVAAQSALSSLHAIAISGMAK